ncbi:MAG: cytochrome ubiquinol oxidase subunit I [Anaerolineales bacterium]|jgi:cytochrome d ubiquinol oxidase subunit I|uniref:cytochrome ubiquinol oxidase subunit I n=1 Tax=Candidatus Villigracilis affinis TaxID=3140682 RepID=UPI001D77DE0C|nr:cytochrome ubiquinol oxidase subunit I [Anaerolineales bacterium]MBK9603196.1 cytochrome ubiquinol oxidase subunit I [Anaerolineales bacterium]MBL0346352.1 cytochrome ubiquinol oxidase subunit I [Anaerolineales bacterium]
MDPITLSRWQFGLTTIYHWLFVPLTLGLGWYVAFFQTRYYQTKDETWRKMAKFWGKLFLINFAIGVVTGIVQEFQFGMNWSEYSRYVGDIFGAPLAVEALMAFFMESTFLGIWIFGEGKVSEKVHLASIWLAAIGSNLSALWILLANGFMQAPPANSFVYNEANGRLELVNFFALIGNPKGWIFFWHTISDGVAMAAFLIIAVSAYHIVRKQNLDFFKRSFNIAAVSGLIAGVLIFLGGHTMGQYMAEVQPMKLAALEAIWETEQPASFSLLTIGDLSGKKEIWSIRIPAAMSFLACNNFTCEVKGVNELQATYEQQYGPGDYIPLMIVTYWTFRIMMAFGVLMILITAYFVWANMRGDITKAKWMKWVPWVLILPYLANASGWILTEMGRQPWIVYGLLKVEDAVSPNLTTVDLLISLIGYTVVYGSLAVSMVYLMKKYAIAGPDAAMHESVDVAPARVGSQD